MWENLCYLVSGEDFLDTKSIAQSIKKKSDKLDFIKMKTSIPKALLKNEKYWEKYY
jgi:hypothetical protein